MKKPVAFPGWTVGAAAVMDAVAALLAGVAAGRTRARGRSRSPARPHQRVLGPVPARDRRPDAPHHARRHRRHARLVAGRAAARLPALPRGRDLVALRRERRRERPGEPDPRRLVGHVARVATGRRVATTRRAGRATAPDAGGRETRPRRPGRSTTDSSPMTDVRLLTIGYEGRAVEELIG